MPFNWFNVMNTGIPSWAAYDMNNCSDYSLLNPNNISIWNPMFSLPFNMGSPNQANINFGIEEAKNFGARQAQIDFAKIAYRFTGNELNYIKGHSQELLKDKGLTDEQKAQIQKIVDAVKERLEHLEEIKKGIMNGSIDPEEGEAEMSELGKDAEELKKQCAEYAKALAEKIETKQGSDDTSNGDVTGTTSANGAGAGNAGVTDGTGVSSNVQVTSKSSQIQGKQIANDIFCAVDGWFGGTDCGQLDTAVKSIDKNNVMETLNFWDKSLKYGSDSMLESIYDDIFAGDKRKEYTLIIAEALQGKAEDLKLEGFEDDVFAIKRMLNNFWRPDGEIYAKINEMQRKINVEIAKRTNAQQKSETANTKAETGKKAADVVAAKADSTTVAPVDTINVQKADTTLVQKRDTVAA